MVITSIFQKLSLVAPVIMGLFIFSEAMTAFKIVAILLTLLSIILINYPFTKTGDERSNFQKYWYWPPLVFFGSGLIECVLFYIQETGKLASGGIAFVSLLFLMAGCWGMLFILFTKKFRFTLRDIMAGICIGIPNFFTIYLIIKGLEIGWDGSVLFPLNNGGVIFMTALVGIFFFMEKFNRVNYFGLFLALMAVILISI